MWWRRGTMRCLWGAGALLLIAEPAQAVTARLAFEQADAGLNGGSGYKDATNETGTLAWGESYIMMAYVEMWHATGDVAWLDRLADHADHVLASRDGERGVKDFAGKSGPCWQSTSYGGNQPYCWVVHSGMITWPMVQLAVEVQQDPALWDHTTWDGTTLLDKAAYIVAEVEKTAAHHQFQWKVVSPDKGTYVGDPAATFTSVAGKVLPLNQQNAMGRTLLALWETTGKVQYLDQAQRLAKYLRAQMTQQTGGAWVWNYGGGAYTAPGEDISHAAINVSFAVACHEAGIVFSDADMAGLGRTFFDNVYKGEDTYANQVGGTGGVNDPSYKAQVGRWVDLTPWAPAAYTAVRRTYDAIGTKVSSGSVLLGWAKLARWEPTLSAHSFYVVDWEDHGTYQKATAYGANILASPPAPLARMAVPLTYRAASDVVVDQWDGGAYHSVAKLPATDGALRSVLVPYEPRVWFPYSAGKILYQFTDAFVAGKGVEVLTPAPGAPPVIERSAGLAAHPGQMVSITLVAAGATPLRWELMMAPPGVSMDPLSGQLAWTASGAGGAIVVAAENDWGTTTATMAATLLPADGDGDGWRWSADCDDANAHTHPKATDYCDGVDNDCDGDIDEECTTVEGTVFLDQDGDGAWDQGEAGMGGVPLVLRSASTVLETTVSGSDGSFALGPTRRRLLSVRARDLTTYGHAPTTPLTVLVDGASGAVTGVVFGVAP